VNAPATPAMRWLLVLALLVYACAFQGVRPLYSPDEGRYTNVALVMLDDGDFLHPMLHHEVPHWSKPPLTYWSIAASVAALGHHEFATRLPGALAFAATVLLLWRVGRRLEPARPWLPALVYATFTFPPLASNLVTTDTLLAAFEMLSVAAFVQVWWPDDERSARRARRVLGLALGLAFLTKGPPGLLPFAACLVFAAWSEGIAGLRRAFAWDAAAIALAVGASWFAVVVWQQPKVLHYFLVEEVVHRVASDRMHRNAEWYGAFKVYGPTLLLGTLPWLPWLVAATWRRRHGLVARVRGDASLRLLACWLLVPLAVFVVSRSRLPLYVLPLFAPIALLVARALRGTPLRRWHFALVALWCVAIAVARALPAYFDVGADDRALARSLADIEPMPGEIAFVDDAPRYGLRFYLDREIERLDLPGDAPQPQAQDLASELAESEGCRLLLATPANADALRAALATLNVGAVELGEVRGYVAIGEQDPGCTWRRRDART
jgi:4-amino-4-deoxy-L-arabinose transferase-like glycosyltransferase